MKSEDKAFEQDMGRGLAEALSRLPHAARIKPTAIRDAIFDLRFDLMLNGRPVKLLVECKRAPYPRDVRAKVGQWQHVAKGAGAVPLLAAHSISEPLRLELRELEVGYFDGSGSLYLPPRAGYVFIDRPPPARTPGRVDVFEGKAQRIVHQLLAESGEWHRVTDMANECGVANSTVSRTLAELERYGWIEAQGAGPYKSRKAAQPGAMLDAWVAAVRSRPAPPLARFFVPGASGMDSVLTRVTQAFRNRVVYAVTHQAAAQVYRPLLTDVPFVRIRAQAGDPLRAALADLEAEQVEEGANLEVLLVAESQDARSQESRKKVHLASPVQAYIDLQGGEGRSRELADKLRQDVIGF